MPRPTSGPPLVVPAAFYAAFTIIGVAAAAGAPLPDASGAETLAYVRSHETALRLSAFGFVAAAIPLAIWTASVSGRLRAWGVGPGAHIAQVGGTIGAALLAFTGLAQWTLMRVETGDAVAKALRDLMFTIGGVGLVTFFGLLLAGVAVPMLLTGTHRRVAIVGIALAAIAELSTLSLLFPVANATLPIARFGGLIWIIVASAMLPLSRPRRTSPESAQ